MNKTETEKVKKLVEKLGDGGAITVEDLESLLGTKVCSPKYALAKAKKGVKLTDAELAGLAKDYKLALEYATLKGEEFPECEPAILASRDVRAIRQYFHVVSCKPNKAYEKWLLKDGGYRQTENILDYIIGNLKDRWPEGEKILLSQDKDDALKLQSHFKIGRWPELEKALFGKNSGMCRVNAVASLELRRRYFKNCGVGRNPELEDILLKKGKGMSIYLYATQCAQGKLIPPLHTKMVLMGGKWSKRYLSWLERKKKSVDLYLSSMNEEVGLETA